MTILNLKNIICLELRCYRDKDLKYLADYLNIYYESLYQLKYNSNSYRIYVDVSNKHNTKIVACMLNSSKGEVSMCDGFVGISKKQMKSLQKMNPILIEIIKPNKNKIESNFMSNRQIPIILELNTILDKISLFGISSLHKEEKDYLDNFK
jgi:hypothetical protein